VKAFFVEFWSLLWFSEVMSAIAVPFTEAKSHLSKYGRMAEQGHTTLVLKHHRAAFMIVPPDAALQAKQKTPGILRGQMQMAPDFDRTPDDVIADFEGIG